MKKFLILFLSAVILFQITIFAGADVYNKDSRYEIDIPDNFTEVGENSFVTEDNSDFYVTFTDNKEEKVCVADMSDKDVKEYVDAILSEGKKVLESQKVDASIKLISAEKIKHNKGIYALVIVLETSFMQDGAEVVSYKKLRVFSGEEHLITFNYSTDEKEKLDNADDVFASIVIHEEQIESKLDKLKSAGIVAVISILMIIGIVWFVKRRSK